MLVKSLNSAVCIFVTPGQISAEDAQRNCCYLGEQRVQFALGRLLLLILVDGGKKIISGTWEQHGSQTWMLTCWSFVQEMGNQHQLKGKTTHGEHWRRLRCASASGGWRNANQTPVLLCSASSFATLISASRTSALSSQVYHSSSSWRKLEVPVVSDTFRVASLHSRSMKPGIFRSVAKKRKTI